MKPHLPIALLSILMGTHIAQAIEIPDDYEQIDLWAPSYLDDYTDNSDEDKYAFFLWTDVDFTPSTNPTWTSYIPLVTGGNLIFTTSEGYNPVALSFSGGQTTAIKQPSNLTFDTLSNLTIANRTSDMFGSAINLDTSGKLYISNVKNGINTPTSDDVVFSENKRSNSSHGAIYANGVSTLIHITNNGNILLSKNSGAIYSKGTVNISDNNDVTFRENTTKNTNYGGAIYSTGIVSIGNNANISFRENSNSSSGTVTSSYGGGIYSTDTINICNNSNVTFNKNLAKASAFNDGYRTPSAVSYGGAIYSTGTINISNNTDVIFRENSTSSSNAGGGSTYSYGGAIYSTGAITIVGNDRVTFEKNYEQVSALVTTYRLRSIYIAPNSSGDNLVLAAKTGGHITFYDSVYMGYSGATVSFNDDYQDADGITQKAKGDIIFSGLYTAEHLEEIKGSAATASEISNSQTSEINKQINLYGGSLQVVDGAKLNGQGLTVAENSGAKLLLRNGSMTHSSYNFTFNNGTTLELQGLNTITASKVTLNSGANLAVTVGEDNLNTAALTLGNTDLSTSKLTVDLNRTDGLTSGMYKIISQNSTSDFTTKSAWTAENVTVNGSGDANRATFSDLVWENGTLYYKVGRTIWGNASGDRLWNTSSDNWTMNDRSYTYLDGMDVTFTDLGAGEVKLVGDVAPADILVNNSEGNDYTFTAANGGGKLVGSTGITKNGTGALTLTTANKHTGATVLNAGTLHVHHSTALGATAAGGTATVTTLAGTTLAIDNNSHVVLAGENSIAGNVNVAEGASLELKNAGYSAAASTVDGTLSFTGTKASTNNAGSLSGTGSVQVTDSNVSFASQSKFTGNLSVQGANASLSISSGAYNGGGALSAQGNGAHLNLGSNNITIKNGGQLKLSSEITETNSTAAKLTANNVTISKGASLSVQGARPEAIADDGSISILTLAEYDADLALNRKQIGIADVTKLTISSGATYEALYGNLSLAQGELTLAVPSSVADKIQFVVRYDGEYNADVQVVLFTDVKTANFIYNGETITATGSQKYTLHAADYFVGEAINTNTQLVYENGTVYLTGVNNVIPEPATATLSLLAMAALAARRRRK